MTRPSLALLAVLFAAAAGRAQQPAPLPPLAGVGSELFRGLLDYHKVEPITLADLHAGGDYRGTIVVLLGDPRESGPLCRPAVQAVLRAGGAVLIATDDGLNLQGYLPAGQVVASRNNVRSRSNGYNGRPDYPYVVPDAPRQIVDSGPEWELFKGLRRVATNQPGVLTHAQPLKYVFSRLARFPADAVVETVNGDQLLRTEWCFAVGGSGPAADPYRCLVLADPTVFSNKMLVGYDQVRREPTDNLAFADRVVRWLKDADGVNRTKCVFVEAGQVQTSFDDVKFAAIDPTPLPPIPVPPIPDFTSPEFQQKVTDTGNRVLADWQDRDGPNRTVAGAPNDDRRFLRAVRTLAVLAALLVFLVVFVRFWKARSHPDVPPVPTDTGRVAASGEPGSLARRKEEILQAGNYTDVVREYLRGLFADRGLPPGAEADPWRMPPVTATGSGRKALAADLRTLWAVAYDPHPQPVTYTRWKELEPMIEDVRRAAEAGRWRFEGGGS